MARADHTGAGGSEQWFARKPTALADRPVMASTTCPSPHIMFLAAYFNRDKPPDGRGDASSQGSLDPDPAGARIPPAARSRRQRWPATFDSSLLVRTGAVPGRPHYYWPQAPFVGSRLRVPRVGTPRDRLTRFGRTKPFGEKPILSTPDATCPHAPER
jgi:hypothetical protein